MPHPVVLIEFLLFGGMLFGLVVLSIVLTGKWRKIIHTSAIVLVIGCAILYFVRPYWVANVQEKKKAIVQIHLEQLYPNEVWDIRTIPYRQEGYENRNPYFVEVIFRNEPYIKYDYFVLDSGQVTQSGYSYLNHMLNPKHWEH
ncbi:hypothetical protein [Solibacillus sp. CAU 1738]|uniref:hypothetical protein n=1 Tax=Solibacillus sp. CAU 1738 TaxID=3140363 RepID=UPI0032608702